MNKEEAIKAIQDFIGWFKPDSRIYKALQMAIQALSQEPCDDAISRQTYADWLDWLCRLRSEINSGMDMARVPQGHRDKYIDVLTEVIDKLPSVTQKTDKYRKEAKRWKNKWLKSQKSGKWIIKEDNTSYVKTIPRRWAECSCCKWSMSPGYVDRYAFCPNCGAKMESEE